MPGLVHPLRVPIDETLNVYRLSWRRRSRCDSEGLPVSVYYRIDTVHVAGWTRGRGACEVEGCGAESTLVGEEIAAVGDIEINTAVRLGVHGEHG